MINNDLLLRTLRFLPLTSKNAAGVVSRLLYVLSREAQRDPQSLSLQGSLLEIGNQLRESLTSPPTFAILIADREVADVKDEIMEFFIHRLPHRCAAVAACSTAFGWGDTRQRIFTQEYADEDSQPHFLLYCLSLADTVSYGIDLLDESALPTPLEHISTVFVTMSRQMLYSDNEAMKILHKRFCDAQVIGGIVEEVVLVKSGSQVKHTALAAIALTSKSAFAVSTRGVEAVSPAVQIDQIVLDEASGQEGKCITHLRAGVDAQSRSIADAFLETVASLRVKCAPVYFGVQTPTQTGYELSTVDSHHLAATGKLWTTCDLVEKGDRCKFFQLRRKACLDDIEGKMQALKEEAKKLGDIIAGCIMVSCTARSEHMMSMPVCDGMLFHRACPDVPFLGLFTPGEIGPSPIAECAAVFTKGKPQLLDHTCCMLVFIVNPEKGGSSFFRAFERGDIPMDSAVRMLL